MKNLRKKTAQILGRKFIYFKGKDKIIRFLFSPDKKLESGDYFEIDYFEKKYQGITSNYIDWGVYVYGGLEKALVNFISSKISDFSYLIDVGSNSGTISLPFCHSKKLKIICFEPLEYSYEKLVNNFKINNAYSNHQFFKLGLSNKIGDQKIFFSKNNSNIGMATLSKNKDLIFDSSENIKVNKLDNILDIKNKKIFLKVDIERHENEFIEGATNLLKNNKILMYLETEDQNLLNKLKKINFKVSFPKFIEGKYFFTEMQNSHHVILKNY